MREVLRVTRDRDVEAALWLEIIDLFDDAVAAPSSAEELVLVAAQATGRPAGIRDEWNGIRLEVTGDGVRADETAGAAVSRAAVARRLRGRNAVELRRAEGAVLAASIEVGAGRIGVAWLAAEDAQAWRPLDYLVVERLATAAALLALAAANRKTQSSGFASTSLELLLSGGLSEYELAQASRCLRLSLGGRYIAIALDQLPPNAVSADALGTIVERALAANGLLARSAVVGRTAAVVAAATETLSAALESIGESEDTLGFSIRGGVGEPTWIGDLPSSWEQAREALTLRQMASGNGSVAFFGELGGLHLLAQIPSEEILESPLFQRLMNSISLHGSPSDIDVLEAYLEERTLRRTAARVFLHHTSVQSRLKRIEETIDVEFTNPAARFELTVLLKLYRILQSRDASSPGL